LAVRLLEFDLWMASRFSFCLQDFWIEEVDELTVSVMSRAIRHTHELAGHPGRVVSAQAHGIVHELTKFVFWLARAEKPPVLAFAAAAQCHGHGSVVRQVEENVGAHIGHRYLAGCQTADQRSIDGLGLAIASEDAEITFDDQEPAWTCVAESASRFASVF